MHGEGTYSENNNIRVLASESACGTSVVKQSRYLSWSHPFADASIRLKKKRKKKRRKNFPTNLVLTNPVFWFIEINSGRTTVFYHLNITNRFSTLFFMKNNP